MKKVFFTILSVGLFVACNNNSNIGKYEGTLPCASCPGIQVSLELKADNTYTLLQEYIDEDLKENNEGKYTETNGVITLENAEGITKVKVESGKAYVLTPEGEIVEGELADYYILTKK